MRFPKSHNASTGLISEHHSEAKCGRVARRPWAMRGVRSGGLSCVNNLRPKINLQRIGIREQLLAALASSLFVVCVALAMSASSVQAADVSVGGQPGRRKSRRRRPAGRRHQPRQRRSNRQRRGHRRLRLLLRVMPAPTVTGAPAAMHRQAYHKLRFWRNDLLHGARWYRRCRRRRHHIRSRRQCECVGDTQWRRLSGGDRARRCQRLELQ